MKYKFLIMLFVAGMAIAGCSSSKNSKSSADSTVVNRTDSAQMDTTKKQPDTTKNQ